MMKWLVIWVVDLLNLVVMLLLVVNVIMQLVVLGVGYGVLESLVDSGNVYKYLFKWVWIIGIYLVVVIIGMEFD